MGLLNIPLSTRPESFLMGGTAGECPSNARQIMLPCWE